MTMRITTRNGQVAELDDAAVEELALRGDVLRPSEEGYDAARSVWNAMVDRRPALIARCAGVADMMTTVRFARDHDLLVSVRGGGHSVAGHAVCDGGLMIDLSPMRSVRIDPDRRRAQVEPGSAAAAYGSNHRRLAEVKHHYDPTNLFQLNSNITPQP